MRNSLFFDNDMQGLDATVYDVNRLKEKYLSEDDYLIYGNTSGKADFVRSRVMHEYGIFKRHVINGLKMVGPFAAYAYLRYKEVSLPIKIPVAFALGYVGATIAGEVLCAAYKFFNLIIGAFISYEYDAFGQWDYLEKDEKPNTTNLKLCLAILVIVSVALSFGIIEIQMPNIL